MNEYYKTDLEFLFRSIKNSNKIVQDILTENEDIAETNREIFKEISVRMIQSIEDLAKLKNE